MKRRTYARCWTCNGTGVLAIVNPDPCIHYGAWDTERCPDCKGTGRTISALSYYNNGTRSRVLSVHVPTGNFQLDPAWLM